MLHVVLLHRGVIHRYKSKQGNILIMIVFLLCGGLSQFLQRSLQSLHIIGNFVTINGNDQNGLNLP